jgi:hypothetical protein
MKALFNFAAAGFGLLVLAGMLAPKDTTTTTTPTQVGRYACGDAIKMQLRDPDSYQLAGFTVDPNNSRTAVATFRARNGFGGYNVGQAVCTLEAAGTRAVITTGG